MFKSAEHAVATSMFMLSTPIYSKNGTQLVIEMLIDRYGHDGLSIVQSQNRLSPHEWRAQAVFIVNAIEKTLGTNSPAYHILVVEFGHIEAATEAAKRLLEIVDITDEKDTDIGFQVDCVLSIFRSKLYTERALSDKYKKDKSYIHRKLASMRVMLYGYLSAGYVRLEYTFRRLKIVEEQNE